MSAGCKNGWPVIAPSHPLPPLSLPPSLCEGDQRDVYAPTLSHQPPPFYAQQLLPFASVYICRHLLILCGIVVQVTAGHLIREMFMPGLLGGLHCLLQCLQYNLPILPPHHRAAGLVSHHLSKQSVLQSSSPNLGICKCTNSENMLRTLTSLHLQSAP